MSYSILDDSNVHHFWGQSPAVDLTEAARALTQDPIPGPIRILTVQTLGNPRDISSYRECQCVKLTCCVGPTARTTCFNDDRLMYAYHEQNKAGALREYLYWISFIYVDHTVIVRTSATRSSPDASLPRPAP